jgi:hypothetical protein
MDIDKRLNIMFDNKIKNLKKKYNDELQGFKFIDNLIDFSLLELQGILRYINKTNDELKFGGILIKIYKKDNNYYAIVKNKYNKLFHVSYNNNYIFYSKNRDNTIKDGLKKLLSDIELGKYNII